ncbi:MAG: prenyltransferase [Candidatus Micrarchaeales archaeon]|nr:prenyltransferase [Candidatus Micrarchaeales archaeon]
MAEESSNNKIRVWSSAFRGFYKPNSKDAKKLDSVSRALFSARSVILVISFQAAVIASILSYRAGMFNPLYSILLVFGLMAAHASSNLINDYFGYMRNLDSKESPRRNYTIHPLASGTFSKRGLRALIGGLLLFSAAIGIIFTYIHGIVVLEFTVAGLLILLFYDTTPITLKEIGLGEIATFVVWGPLMIGGGYYALTGQLSIDAFFVSIPYGLGVMSILVGKHIDQMKFDASKHQKTLPVLLGSANARTLNVFIIIAMYALVPIFIFLNALTIFALVVLMNAPMAASALRVFLHPKPRGPPRGYVGWPLWYHRYSLINNRNFGWLYILGLLIGAVLAI